MNEIVRTEWASAWNNGDWYYIYTRSGFAGGNSIDPQVEPHLLPPDASDIDLGLALLASLAHSRFLPKDEALQFLRRDLLAARYEEFVKSLMARCGYKTRRALFKNMNNCWVDRREGIITIKPTNHNKLEGWGRTKNDGIEDVVISADRSAAEIGAALRLAFSRCI
jgi:hypothetical protein